MRNPLQLVQSQSGVTGAGLQQYTVTSPLMSQASTTQVRATIIFTLVTGHKSIATQDRTQYYTGCGNTHDILLLQAAAAQGQLASSPAGIPTLDSSGQGIYKIIILILQYLGIQEIRTVTRQCLACH